MGRRRKTLAAWNHLREFELREAMQEAFTHYLNDHPGVQIVTTEKSRSVEQSSASNLALDCFTWGRGGKSRRHLLTIRELTLAYWVVLVRSDSIERQDLSYAMFQEMYQGIGLTLPHKAQVAALLNALVELGWIKKTSGHSPNNAKGNTYVPT